MISHSYVVFNQFKSLSSLQSINKATIMEKPLGHSFARNIANNLLKIHKGKV
ncbi:hypothetical protein SMITH_615 [Smithella sp. ME-1]|uniref:Uncharacterized protein n=1 Tax=hydrocarbon metagenome TaxID=938273 RepID=A0A0W8FLF5_9ZZZZ|nr:hypothetical protein SMITH_615 [Smithella sp. ME-1]